MNEFIHAANVAREGLLGKISLMKAHVGDGPKPYDLPKQDVPQGLDWDLWLGPLDTKWHYNHELNPLLNENGGDECWGAWRWYQGMGGGYTTDWGAHMFDIGQWAIGKDGSGPVEILPPSASPYDCLTFRYDNGIEMTQQKFDGGKQGIKIIGENGWIQVCRGEFLASSPEFMPKKSMKRLFMKPMYRIIKSSSIAFVHVVIRMFLLKWDIVLAQYVHWVTLPMSSIDLYNGILSYRNL